MTHAATETLFERIRPWKAFRSSAEHLFPTDDSLRWFLRTHGSTLESTGAILKLGRGVYVDPAKFKLVALSLMKAPSAAKAEAATSFCGLQG